MNTKSISRTEQQYVFFSHVASLMAIVIGSLVLLGWVLNSTRLKSVLPGYTTMKATTAICFILSGFALWCMQLGPRSSRWDRTSTSVAQACAATVAIVSLVTLGEYLLGLDAGIDQLLFLAMDTAPSQFPGRMAPATALICVLLGSALVLLDVESRHGRRPAQYLALVATLVGWLAFLGYLFNVELFYQVFLSTSVALHTTLLTIVLGCGVLAARPDRSLMAVITSNRAGGTIARRLLPVVIFLPILTAWLRSEGQEQGLYASEFGSVLSIMSNLLIAATVIWLTARSLNQSDAAHQVAEEALQRSEERYRILNQLISDYAFSMRVEADGTLWYEWVSESFTKVTGHTMAEALGTPNLLHPSMHPEDRERIAAIISRLGPGMTSDYEFRLTRRDGSLCWLRAYIQPFFNEQGRLVHIYGATQDITERKRAEDKAQAQLARLELLAQITRATGEHQDLPSIFQVVVRSLEDRLPLDFSCVCLYDRVDHTLTVTNVGLQSEALAVDLALTEQARIPIDENGLARSVRGQLIYEPDIEQIAFPFPQRLAHGGLGALVIAPLIVESTVFGVLIGARRQLHSFSSGECEFLRQVSEHVALAAHQAQLYSALQQAYDDLRHTQQAVLQQERLRALGQMASGIAHDINNAISPIALYTESLLEREANLSARARDYLVTIQRASEDIAHTVARMREFYRQREPQLILSSVDLTHLLPQVVDLTRARWSDMPQQRGVVIDLRTDLAPDLPAIMGVESELREALINLVFNAVDAMPEGGTLTLRTRAVGAAPLNGTPESLTHVQVEICDTGVGMDEETRRRCLEPFFTTKGERGTGLGLAMVYGIVNRHSGELEIESAVGQGTTMRLLFAAAVAEGRAAPEVLPQAPSRLRLLIVDDDPLLLKSLQDTLKSDGHVVVAANGGQNGIDTFGTAAQGGEAFAAVITDLGMPYVDGRRVAAAIKAVAPPTPVILLTGWGQRLEAEGEVPLHVDRILSKPPKLRELRATLAELTGNMTRPGRL